MASEEAKEYNLKPCPFCGSSDLRVHIGVHEQTVHCHGCFVLGILSEWNRRASEPRWIPVSERLPEENQNVLVIVSGYSEPTIARRYGDEWDEAGSDSVYLRKDVTHWQPLPALTEPPKP